MNIISKRLGVLRPVNQYGYIRATHIFSAHSIKLMSHQSTNKVS